jgi:ankyrin repeat protein
VAKNDLPEIEKFVDFNGCTEDDLFDLDRHSLLHQAAANGQIEALTLLIQRTAASPDIVNSKQETPLHSACANDRSEVIEFLIGCGANINLQDEQGRTPLMVCCERQHLPAIKVICEASEQLAEALESDLPNHDGITPLQYSV